MFAGADGNVEESIAVMKDLEEVKAKKKRAEDEYHAMIPRHAAQQQKLRACEVCGAFLSMYDNDRRLADHVGGKLHIGFVTIRDKITQLEVRDTRGRRRDGGWVGGWEQTRRMGGVVGCGACIDQQTNPIFVELQLSSLHTCMYMYMCT